MQGYKTILAAILIWLAQEGVIHLTPDQAQQYIGLIPDASLALMIAMRLFTTTPVGQKAVDTAAADIVKIDPGFDLKAWLDAKLPSQVSLSALLSSLSQLHAKVDAIRAQPPASAPNAGPIPIRPPAPPPQTAVGGGQVPPPLGFQTGSTP